MSDQVREKLAEYVLSQYLGERCVYCGKKYETLADLEDVVWAGKGRKLACKSCWEKCNKTSV